MSFPGSTSGGSQEAGTGERRRGDSPPDGGLARQLWLLRRRRGLLVSPRHQLRAAVLACLPVLPLLAAVNGLLYLLRVTELELVVATAPALEGTLNTVTFREVAAALLSSVIVLAGVFLVAIIETHRTAGAALNVARCLERAAAGSYAVRLTLRSGDNLRELEAPFNRLLGRLAEQAAADADRFEELAARLDDAGSAAGVAAALRELAGDRRQTLG